MGLVIAVANQKGGVGKTTTTMNLAGVFQSEGYKVYVADADGQQSCMSWCAAAGPETPLPFRVGSIHRLDKMIGPEIAALANDYDVVIVDCPPNISDLTTARVLAVADVTVIPTDASPIDIWSSEGMIELVERTRVANPDGKFAILLNKANSKTLLHMQMSAILAESNVRVLSATVKQRELYRQSAALGRTVFDVRGIRGTKVARDEVSAVYNEILALVQEDEAEVVDGN
jgi:chromosome partitioning protein